MDRSPRSWQRPFPIIASFTDAIADAVASVRLSATGRDLDVTGDGERADLSLDRVLVMDALDTSGDENDHRSNLPNDNDDMEGADLVRNRQSQQTMNGIAFGFSASHTEKYAFISRRVDMQPGAHARVHDDWEKECDKKFPASKSQKRNGRCKQKVMTESFARGFALVVFPDVVVRREIEGADKCNLTTSLNDVNKWCQKAFGKEGIDYQPCFDTCRSDAMRKCKRLADRGKRQQTFRPLLVAPVC
ncbi:hypothetical protein HDU96_003782 [Phlyctochytrium bullatum]|nr:hypothetical protein HDU96_003782 [Phlyctochytrium bullatum]